MKSYSEKLRDPRWQQMRLKVLERDNWTCQLCGATKKSLNVHHTFYNDDPWDVPPASLFTICEDCHQGQHVEHRSAVNALLTTFAEFGIRTSWEFLLLLEEAENNCVHGSNFAHSDTWTEDFRAESFASAIHTFRAYKAERIADGTWWDLYDGLDGK